MLDGLRLAWEMKVTLKTGHGHYGDEKTYHVALMGLDGNVGMYASEFPVSVRQYSW
jgi:hypothetical protein